MSHIDLDRLFPLPDATASEQAALASRLATQQPAFALAEDCLAILAFGGTIQSAYVPASENIQPVAMNPALLRLEEVAERFHILEQRLTGTILVAKDSREVTNADLTSLIHTISFIPNKLVLVTCGTYMLPVIGRALAKAFSGEKSGKIIGITGSWLPPSQEGQDVDLNIGGTIAALNAFRQAGQDSIVFAHFHGAIFIGDALADLNLHKHGVNPFFKRKYVEAI